MLKESDRQLLRQLADSYMSAATLPVQKEKIALWKALNRGEMQRPMVVIDQLPWHELNTDGVLDCKISDPFWRSVEQGLRRALYKWERFPVDMVLEPLIRIPKAVTGMDYGIAEQEQQAVVDDQNDVVSHHYDNLLQEMEDAALIKDMHIEHDAAETARRLDEAKQIFSGIAEVETSGVQFHSGVWDMLSKLMGVENIYFEIADRPELLHSMMRRITDATIAGIEQADALKLHDDNSNICHCSYIYTDEMLPGAGMGKGAMASNCWTFGMAQLFTSVSPDTFKELELPYITEIASRFGALYYGCCERLDDRVELVKTIPNLRKISCSPWSRRDVFAEKLGHRLVMSVKPNPAILAAESFDPDETRRDIMDAVDTARRYGCNLELILKDLSTVAYQPERIAQWAEVAMQLVQE